MADLKVDYQMLEAMSRSMAAIAAEFENLHDHRDVEKSIWGGVSIRSGMDDFASNWDRHRSDLTEQIRKLGEKCGATCETFQGVEQALTRGAGGE
jgi:uncharacterized protein YukE